MENQPMLNDLEFESKIKTMADRELLEFTARQVFSVSQLCPTHHKRIKSLENRDKKNFAITGGVGAIIGTVLASALDYLLRR